MSWRHGLLVLLAALIGYIWRHVVEDKIPLQLREKVPATPEEAAGTAPAAAPAAT